METIQPRNGMIDLACAEARLPRWMLGLGVAATLTGGVTAGPRVAAGLAVGASLAILNYYWLHEAIVALASAGQARVPRLLAAKFALRYPLAIAGLFLIYKTAWLPLAAILAGLFVPVVGVLAEAFVQIGAGWREP